MRKVTLQMTLDEAVTARHALQVALEDVTFLDNISVQEEGQLRVAAMKLEMAIDRVRTVDRSWP